MPSLIEMVNVDAYYGDAHVLHGVSLKVERGEVVCLIGRNGVGKSTTIKAIMGIVKVKNGRIFYKGDETTNLPPYKIFLQKRIGYVPEERRIFATLTVKENLLMSQMHFKTGNKWDLEKVLQIFPALKDKLHRSGAELSGGEQQMLAIGRSLMCSPDVILLDEPCEGLAPIIVQELSESIQKLYLEGITILLVEQSLTLSKVIGERFYVMNKGAIQFSGTRDELFQNEEVIQQFVGLG